METALAIYGAALATLIAIAQGVSALRRRARIGVSTALTFGSLDEGSRESAHGTPVQVDREGHVSWQEVLLRLNVRNEGGMPVQIVAVVIESLRPDGEVNISQFAPEPLPHVLDPGTRIEIAMQKEPIDMLDNITFFGVTDALGRRYASAAEEVRQVVRRSWDLPTRVKQYVQRADPSGPPVLAYQNRERSALIDTTRSGKRVAELVSRRPMLDDPSKPRPST